MICIIDYGMGNLRSVSKAFEYLGAEVIISNRQKDIEAADKIVLPGVGAFGKAMKNLAELNLVEILGNEILKKRKHFIGICLGMQLLATRSYELGEFKGLGWIKGEVRKVAGGYPELKVPHVGWNDINIKKESALLSGIKDKSSFYFVHSYAFYPEDQSTVLATCNYGNEFAAAIEKDNIYATQFHPEKSQKAGLKLIENFINLK